MRFVTRKTMQFVKTLSLCLCIGYYGLSSIGVGDVRAVNFIDQALSHPDRPSSDRNADLLRHPADVLRLTGIRPGMHVVDLMAGSGWYTEILARIVGPDGLVYAQNNRISKLNYGGALAYRLKTANLPNIVRLDQELEKLELPHGLIDIVFLVQFYHDTYWMGVDRERMNLNIYQVLKPGGMYCVIDHRAKANTGSRYTQSLHRVDPEKVKAEILTAGFKLTKVSDLLHNPDDDHTKSVFDGDIRGRTDRFLFIFQKPGFP